MVDLDPARIKRREQVADWLQQANRPRELHEWVEDLKPEAASFVIALMTQCEALEVAVDLKPAVSGDYGGINGLAGALAHRLFFELEGKPGMSRSDAMAIFGTAFRAIAITDQRSRWGANDVITAISNSFLDPKTAKRIAKNLRAIRSDSDRSQD